MPPRKLDTNVMGAHWMIKHLFSMGVRPEALLLPRRADRGHCKLRCLASLQAVIDVLLEESPDLSPHTEVNATLSTFSCAFRGPPCPGALLV